MVALRRTRISDVETFIVAGGRWGWVVVRISTEDGWYGVGEASLEGREVSIATAVSELRRYLLGQDPADIARHNFALYREPIWSGGPVLQCAISGIDMALWDLKAKRLEVPLYELLGGKMRPELRLYANGWYYGGGTPDDVADAARTVMTQGFVGLKFNPFNRQPGTEPFYLSPAVLRTGVEYVAAVREAIGPDADLLVDLNACFLNLGDVLRVAKALEPFDLTFLEEPLAQENHAAMAELRRRTSIPVATGERLFSTFEFDALLRAGAADVVQPDLAHCGGISAAMKIAARAEMAYVPVAPHNPNGPICESASAHLALAIPNFGMLEMFPGEPWRPEVVGRPYEVVDGLLRVNEQPGLGIDFDEQAALARPDTSKDIASFHERNFTGHAR